MTLTSLSSGTVACVLFLNASLFLNAPVYERIGVARRANSPIRL